MGATLFSQQDELPPDFPEINWLISDNPSEEGYLFFAPYESWGSPVNFSPFMIIMDNRGTPVFYQKQNFPVYDFKVQPNGEITFWGGSYGQKFFFMNDLYQIGREVEGTNGTDFHELILLENGNVLVITNESRIVDMDTVVPGGHPGVTVNGNLVQEFTTDAGLVRQYSTWDLYEITDAYEFFVDLQDPDYIDYAHINAIEVDTDTTLLLSPRNLNEITRIHKETGDIIWRLNGKNNDFTFIDDPYRFSAQHDVRKLENGNIQIFDNGVDNDPQFSSVVEYLIDEDNMTATLLNRIRSQPNDIFGMIMGSARRLQDGNLLVGWGSGRPNVTEFHPDGSKALEFDFEGKHYRIFRFPWNTGIFTFDNEVLEFGDVKIGTEATKDLKITNNTEGALEINRSITFQDDIFLVDGQLPITLPGQGSVDVTLKFMPSDTGYIEDRITLCYDIDAGGTTQRIARQVIVKGKGTEDTGLEDLYAGKIKFGPNPGNGIVSVDNPQNNISSLRVLNIQGKLVRSINKPGDKTIILDFSSQPAGIYLLEVMNHPGYRQTLRYIKIN